MKPRVYIDGAAGTTGLEIGLRLSARTDIDLIVLADSTRKDPAARASALNEADIAVLCLPDEAARQALTLIENRAVRVLDASTAHRTTTGWVYGFPELEAGRGGQIAMANRVSNPGCYATGFLALVRPLVREGIVPSGFPLTVNAVSGYSGGGGTMIEEFENKSSPGFTKTNVRTYALSLSHKHVPEMRVHAGLDHAPLFAPSVGRFYRGMLVEVPLQLWALPGNPTPAAIHATLSQTYAGQPLVQVEPLKPSGTASILDAEKLAGSDRMELYVLGNEAAKQVRLVAVLDNLGKGASGAAVQNLNLMLGLPEETGLK
ncbi:MAG TPA: N-acetyl-gamma-glutamyl-phosphate reductase [Rhizomicrobium sp.]